MKVILILAVMSGYRLWYCPSVGYVFAPVFFVVGIIVIALVVIIAVLEGDPSILGNCNFRHYNYHIFIAFGVFGAGICWGLFIWWSMWKRIKILKNIQENTSNNNSFEQCYN